MTKTLDVNVHMNSLHTHRDSSLGRVVASRYKKILANTSEEKFWDETSFELNHVDIFRNCSADLREKIIFENCQDRIEEAFHIEKSGMAYGAKMTLLSETLDERILYGTFTGDESRHFQLISKYIQRREISAEGNPFLQLLSSMIETAPKKSLVFMIQVLLEGWGMDHYNSMAKSCLNSSLKEDLSSILADEASHHGSGLILFNEKNLSLEDRDYIKLSLESFFSMVQCGPLSVFNRVTESVNGLSTNNKREILIQMNAMKSTQTKLDQLVSLMKKSGAHDLLSEMDSRGKLKSFDIDQMLSIA
ncbi:ferritin-like domain-containing protein [Halobacteriovorax sp. JY17]|uniref:ferritin-like domain-containing protein n=1 Tax=Halobacteriovorax sp. JY17 TaxID=2014617 RepID=UPI000C3B7626|nr:ferritin-like domain-containing protein [Halobacteriovorax sp. JY17]PIK15767.1 MAG: hypothetical protein CES88_03300 [Halobacteriovorax sp. JY17]